MPYTNFLSSLPDQVAAALAGKIKRTDCAVTLKGVTYDVSIYRMTDTLARVDFKIPKPKKQS